MKKYLGKRARILFVAFFGISLFAGVFCNAPAILEIIQDKRALRSFVDVMKELDPALAVLVVLIGLGEWIAARHDLDSHLNRLNTALRKKEFQLVTLLLSGNIRVKAVLMGPCFTAGKGVKNGLYCSREESGGERGGERCVYRVLIFFQNLSQRAVKNMSLEKAEFKINGEKFFFKADSGQSDYWLDNASPCLEFLLDLKKDEKAERFFSQFYFYYWQLKSGFETMELEAEVKYWVMGDEKTHKGRVKADLRIEPEAIERPELEKVEGLNPIASLNKITVVQQMVSKVL